MSETNTQKIYSKAKEAGKVSERSKWLRLGTKKEGGGVESTGPHKLKFIDDKVVMGQDYHTKQERKEMKYTFEENGEEKFYSVPLFNEDGDVHYLIVAMKDFNYGEWLVLELKRSGQTNFVDVRKAEEEEEEEDDIPVIEDDTPENDIDVDEIQF